MPSIRHLLSIPLQSFGGIINCESTLGSSEEEPVREETIIKYLIP